jgi:hypothetical protein
MRARLRRLRFALLERIVLPLAAAPLRWWIGSWRLEGPAAEPLAQLQRAPRVVIVTFHGMLLHLLAFRRLAAPRRLVVMLSPSLDGRLLAAALARFGIDHVCAASGSRGVAGSLELIERLRRGDVGVVAADGPRGPCGVVKPGALRLAAAAEAHLALMVTGARWGLRFGSWDRAHLPLPLSRVAASLQVTPPPAAADETATAALAESMVRQARSLRSPS